MRRRRLQTQEIGRALGRDRRQHRAVHGRHAPATTCTTAATTSSRSPHVCEFEEIAYLLIHEKLPDARRARHLQEPAQVAARTAGDGAHGARAAARRLPIPWMCLRTGVSALGCSMPEKAEHGAAGARDIADRLIASLGSMLTYWYHFSQPRRAHRGRDRRRFGRRALPAPAARQARAGVLGARHAHLAHPVRRARVQRLDLRGARHRRHRLRHLFVPRRVRSARCAGPSTAAPTRWRSRSSSATRPPRRRRPTSARAWRATEVIIGFGHPVYTLADPRNEVIKEVAESLARDAGDAAAVRDRRAHRVGDARGQAHVPQPRLVLGRLLPPDGRPQRRCSRRCS